MPDELRILSADLSQRCPGFAILTYRDGIVRLERLQHLNSRGKALVHGQILSAIYEALISLSQNIDVFVRERAFARFSRETLALSKVIGVADLAAWQYARKSYHEIAPSAVKKLLTGSGKASKEEVAAALEQFLYSQHYACDDESDAAAVGIAWLIQTGHLKTDPRDSS